MKRKVQLRLMLVAFILVCTVIIILLTNLAMSDDKILKGVYIESIDVSGLTAKEATKILEEKYQNPDIKLTYGDKSIDVDLKDLGVDLDVNNSVEKALKIGKDSNIFSDFGTIISHKIFGKENHISIANNLNRSTIEKNIKEITSDLNTEAKNATISVNGGIINIAPEENGRIVNTNKLTDTLLKAIKNYSFPLDIKLEVEEEIPPITEETLSPINGRIARYVTTFNASEESRAYNVGLAASRITDKLLRPGDEISFLDTLGEISEKSGYKSSIIIVNDEYIDGIGGGVCQVSTTLYNALLLADVSITYRVNHSFPIDYAPLGRDATVATPGPDLKFKNTNSYPIYLVNYTSGNQMISEVYGNVDKHSPIEIYSEILETYEPEKKYVDDPELPEGKEVIEKKGKPGYKVATYKVQNGEKKRITLDTYAKKNEVIKRGTGPKEENAENNPNQNATTPTNNPANENPTSPTDNQLDEPEKNPIF